VTVADRKAERHGEVVGYDIPVKKRDPEEAGDQGNLIISPVVYAELVAAPNRDEGFVDGFLQDTRVDVLWDMLPKVWRRDANANRAYVIRRRQAKGDEGPRRILADFLIGAHALDYGARLLTFDKGIYKQSFPELDLVLLEAE
jgi:predicted nucleic acid-binding protein